MLVRDFIRESLYNRTKGYFSRIDCVLRPPPLDLNKLFGSFEYNARVREIYRAKRNNVWLTPVELFKPWYSRAIGTYIVQAFLESNTNQLRIFELGAGNGTNADLILDYIREKSEEIYFNTKYTLIEISKAMAERQQELLTQQHDPKVFEVICCDVTGWKGPITFDECFIIGLELLDNLPHDKLIRYTNKDFSDENEAWVYTEDNSKEWKQAVVVNENGSPLERHKPLVDKLAIDCARHFLTKSSPASSFSANTILDLLVNPSLAVDHIVEAFQKRGRRSFESLRPSKEMWPIFIPTGAYQLINNLHDYFPRHKLILADFNYLPPPEISMQTLLNQRNRSSSLLGCKNAPIVSGETQDYVSYLDAPGDCDIFFQTDFPKLAEMYERIGEQKNRYSRQTKILTSKSFLIKYGEIEKTRTRTGYNPMLEDYSNTSFLLNNTKSTDSSREVRCN